MKTMTCRQLYGPCDVLIHGETAKKMMENSKEHGMEMAAKGDADHIRVMQGMRQHANDPKAVQKFMNEFQIAFAAQPEDK